MQVIVIVGGQYINWLAVARNLSLQATIRGNTSSDTTCLAIEMKKNVTDCGNKRERDKRKCKQ